MHPIEQEHTCVVSRSQSGGLVPILGIVFEEVFYSLSYQGWLIPALQEF